MPVDAVADLTKGQRSELVELYQHEWWTEGREREDVDRMLDASDVVVGLVDSASGALVAFARALTDGVYKALVFDVIVAGGRRGGGLGERLMEELVNHPMLAPIEHIELYCLAELVPFYERWCFSDDLGEFQLLRREA